MSIVFILIGFWYRYTSLKNNHARFLNVHKMIKLFLCCNLTSDIGIRVKLAISKYTYMSFEGTELNIVHKLINLLINFTSGERKTLQPQYCRKYAISFYRSSERSLTERSPVQSIIRHWNTRVVRRTFVDLAAIDRACNWVALIDELWRIWRVRRAIKR